MVNANALILKMKEMNVSFEDLVTVLDIPLIRVQQIILGSTDMYVDQAEKIQETLKIQDSDFGYYFFYNPRTAYRL